MKLDFNKPLLNVDGTPIKENEEEVLMSRIMINALTYVTDGAPPLKALHWMEKMHAGEVLDLDPTDQEMLKRLITDGFKGMGMLVKARLLEVFELKAETKPGTTGE